MPPTGQEAVFVFGTIAVKRGGATRTVLSRMRLYAEAGIKVRLLLLGHGPYEDDEETVIRAEWGFPDSVEIRYFWREAAPAGGGAAADPLAHAAEEPGTTSFTESAGEGVRVRFFSDGVLVKIKNFTHRGRLVRIDRYDAARRTVSREYFDQLGRLVRVDNVSPESGKPALRRFFDRSGSCWLTSWVNKAGEAAATVRHLPTPVAYDDFGQCAAEWVDDVLAQSRAPVVFCDKRAYDQVLVAMTHPTVRRVAVLHSCHTAKPYRASDPVRANWGTLFTHIRAFDSVVAMTTQQCSDITDRYGTGNVTVINPPSPQVPELTVTREPGLLVAIARLETEKRLGHAIRAFAHIAARAPGARFDIYGTGPEANALESLITELDVADRVRLRGFTARPLEVFASATATVLSSSYEGWGLVMNEAMAVGTPVVAYDINYGPAEVVRHEVDGLLAPAGDIEALATAMGELLADPDYAAALGQRARDVTERFSLERWSREWHQLFTRLVTAPAVAAEADREQRQGAPPGGRTWTGRS